LFGNDVDNSVEDHTFTRKRPKLRECISVLYQWHTRCSPVNECADSDSRCIGTRVAATNGDLHSGFVIK